jgi:hypothetical protein
MFIGTLICTIAETDATAVRLELQDFGQAHQSAFKALDKAARFV